MAAENGAGMAARKSDSESIAEKRAMSMPGSYSDAVFF